MVIAKYARVLHSPLEEMFVVQYKPWWFGTWSNDTVVRYYPEGETPSPHGALYNQPQAATTAFRRVDILLERAVVYDQKR
jgi:hypothetical protein